MATNVEGLPNAVNEAPDRPAVLIFNTFCRAAALAWLAIAIPASLVLHPSNDHDFAQNYMGGLVARLGEWNALYPIPQPTADGNAGVPANSQMHPRYAELARWAGIGDRNRFIQPPPVALIFAPFSLLGYEQASWVWTGIGILCVWGIGLHAGRFYGLLAGRQTRTSGLIVLLICCSPLAYRALRTGQVSPVLGLLLAVALLGIIQRRSLLPGVSLTLAAFIKFVSLPLVFLLAATRRWLVLGWMAALITGVAAVTLAITGPEPFYVFAREIAPTLMRPFAWRGNQSIYGLFLRTLGPLSESATLYIQTAQALMLLALLLALFRPAAWSLQRLFAGTAASLLWMLIFSPICWEHYFLYLCPLWGWLAWEMGQSRWRTALALAALLLTWAPVTVLVPMPEPLQSHMLIGALLMLVLAMARLFAPPPVNQTETTRGQ